MYIESLLGLSARDCIDTNACPVPTCGCPSDQTCNFISTSCSRCSYFECQPKTTGSSSSGGGVGAGAVAGAVVGSLVFLALTFGLFLWYRRTQRRNAAALGPQVKDVPASAADVLNRPDPMEKRYTAQFPPPTEMNTVRVYSTSSNTTIDLDPASQTTTDHSVTRQPSVRSNPFEDNHSIQTTGTEGTNVIPIALVAPDSQSQHHSVSASSDAISRSTSPVRPARSPELDLNLEHVNVSHDSLKQPGKYPTSTRSGVSGVSRNSYMSSASYSSDFLNEAPMIITPNKGAVRQVLGVVKAEMVNAPSHSSTSSEGLRPSDRVSKPAVRSPLAASSFGPSDLASETTSISEEGGNPFSDKHSTRTTLASSPAASHTTFGEPSPGIGSNSDWGSISAPRPPWAKDDDSRPSSVSTQAGSVVDIVNVSRVNLGLGQLSGDSGAPTPRTPYRTTMARLVSPPGSSSERGTFEQQQQRALAHAQAQAQAQGGLQSRRISASSAMSGTSTRADSILESFPFVPPSPISNRPIRSPPLSPNTQHSFNVSPPSPLSPKNFPTASADPERLTSDSDLPAPPSRQTLGLSTGSQLSTASTGLGSFPFHIDTGSSNDSAPPAAFNGRQRASLDTLAITSDLSSFPLGFDRDSVTVPLPRRN